MRYILWISLLCVALANAEAAKSVPELKLSDLSGHPQKLSSLRGRIVVLSFWATWCGPCKEELPRLSRLSQSYSDQRVEFVAISIDDAKDVPKIEPFLKEQRIQLNVWRGATTETMARVGLGEIVPSTLILDQHGEAITRIEGEAQEEDIRSRVDWLLAGKIGPAPESKLKRY